MMNCLHAEGRVLQARFGVGRIMGDDKRRQSVSKAGAGQQKTDTRLVILRDVGCDRGRRSRT